MRLERFAAGGIEVTKTIAGDGAGLQGEVEILVTCTPPDGGDTIERRESIPAGAAAGSQGVSFTGLPAGSECVVTEPQDGDNEQVNLTATSIEPGTVTVVAGTDVPVAVTNEYERAAGALQVTKRIGGPAAGEQGEIILVLDCDDEGDAFDQELTVPAGTAAGEHEVAVVTGIPAGTQCQVTETASGVTEQIVLVEPTTIEPGIVEIAEGETSEVTVTNTYREEEHGGGGGGGDVGGGGSTSSGLLPDAGGPAAPLLPLGLALVAVGAAVLTAERRLARKP